MENNSTFLRKRVDIYSTSMYHERKLNVMQLPGGEKIANLKLLKEKIDDSGMTMVAIAKKQIY